MLSETYRRYDHLQDGKRYNRGVGVSVQKRSGKVAGWVVCSWGMARRIFPGTVYLRWFFANHDCGINQVEDRRVARRFTVTQTLIFLISLFLLPSVIVFALFLLSLNRIGEKYVFSAKRYYIIRCTPIFSTS